MGPALATGPNALTFILSLLAATFLLTYGVMGVLNLTAKHGTTQAYSPRRFEPGGNRVESSGDTAVSGHPSFRTTTCDRHLKERSLRWNNLLRPIPQ
jgi:hypothetical protein